METIKSFTIDHRKLNYGLYVSRVDHIKGNPITTYDIRMSLPNREPAMTTAGLHAIEHLGATYLRNSYLSQDVIYFGPMGCRTGFYLILAGSRNSRDVKLLIREMMHFIVEYKGKIPGASIKECGNYLDLNLEDAKFYCKKYLTLMGEEKLEYLYKEEL